MKRVEMTLPAQSQFRRRAEEGKGSGIPERKPDRAPEPEPDNGRPGRSPVARAETGGRIRRRTPAPDAELTLAG
jgi:hypothetical protein